MTDDAARKKGLLDTGDTVEFGLTAALQIGKEEYWVKYGVTVHVRPGESTARARARAEKFVQDSINAKVEEIVSGG